jgi:hypothetical protein
MRFATTVVLVFAVMLLGLSIFAATQSKDAMAHSTLPPARQTGAPGDGSCLNCHNGNGGVSGTIGGKGFFAVPLSGLMEYIPGKTDTIGIVVNVPAERWGFQATILTGSTGMAGTLSPFSDPDLAILTAFQSSGGRTYVSHTDNGATAPFTGNDGTFWGLPGAGWAFEWTAPPAGTGPVTIYLAGVAGIADDDATNADTTYTWTLTLQEGGTTPVQPTTWGKIKQYYR